MGVYPSTAASNQLNQPAKPGTASPGPRAWTALAMLSLVYVLNFLSRQLPAILAKPIQDDLGVSDGRLGLISGLYFALFYCFISIPVGWLADKSNRSRILAAACAIWSLATMGCGLAGSYAHFVIAYMTVGFGEAGGVPPSYSIISDYFPSGSRGKALGIFNLGAAIGATLAIAFGAWIAAAFSWRRAFLVLGGAGLFVAAAVLFTVREPNRGGFDLGSTKAAAKTSLPRALGMFFSRPTLVLAGLAAGATQFITYGLGNFAVLFLTREKGMLLRQVALYYALTVLIGVGGGMIVSGRLIDRFTRVSRKAYALIPAASLSLAIPLFLGFVSAPSWSLALCLLCPTIFLNYFYLSSVVTFVQEEVRPDQRVVSGALLLLVMNFIGLGLGPTYVGAASDHFRPTHPHTSLQMALYGLAPFYVVAIVLFLALARVLQQENSAS